MNYNRNKKKFDVYLEELILFRSYKLKTVFDIVSLKNLNKLFNMKRKINGALNFECEEDVINIYRVIKKSCINFDTSNGIHCK